MTTFTDNPIDSVKEDKYGFKRYVHILKDMILQTEPLPFCVGIFGEWGSGKTSFMNMIRGLIDEQYNAETMPVQPGLNDDWLNVRTIWFNPWKYDKKEDLWNALIQSIIYSILEEKTLGEGVKEKAKKLALATSWLAVKKAITGVTAGMVSETNLDNLVEAINKKDEAYYEHINLFESHFKEVVDDYTHGGKLIIFIDDLDRCLPENAITVLESLKLFIGHANCIFVLGMDHYVVEEGIKHRYEGKLKMNGRDYLDKIIQVPFFLPPVSYKDLKDSFQTGEESKFLTEEIWKIIRLGMKGNPRKTKRFINCFSLLQRFLTQKSHIPGLDHKTQNFYLAKLLVFQMSFPEFYQHLQNYPEEWDSLEQSLINIKDVSLSQLWKNMPEFELLRENPHFQAFVRDTASNAAPDYPHAPSGKVVSQLLQITSLVTETP